ncbi:MAG TPA: NYN domain-containing protein, partial [Thermoanaerobaculia bacterium]|nr:NYN domain-containing protein [Thermoanaerobaculia bacterium]
MAAEATPPAAPATEAVTPRADWRQFPRETPEAEAPSDRAAESPVFPEIPAVLALPFEDEEDDEDDEPVSAAGSEVGEVSDIDDSEDADDEPEAASEDGQEGAEGEAKPDGRRKRSRRSRGRRKTGRAATAAEGAPDEDEDEAVAAEPAPAAEERRPSPEEKREERRVQAEERREERRAAAEERREERRLAAAAAPAPAHEERRFAPAPLARSARADSYVIPHEESGSAREIIISVPEPRRSMADERKIAVFCDLENIALGVRDSEISKFDINLILERLLEKGKIIVKKAYADWERYSEYKRPFHEAAIELIDIPQKFYSGKNSADIKMVVDAMDLSYSKEHLDTFVLLSGDSDFSPLVSKLKENNKYVIGIGVKNSSSALLIDNCDEFIYYEDVWRDTQKGPKLDGLNKKTAEAFSLMIESIQALIRENKDVLWGSMIKQTMQRKKPSFNEGYYGYSTFSELLEDAER